MTDAPSFRVPATPREIRDALAAAGLTAHKRFGQNFLGDARVLDRIMEQASITPGELVLEVGPGLGVLTARLLAAGARLIAVEIDHGLARQIRATFGNHPRLTLIEGDVLDGKQALSRLVLDALRESAPSASSAGFSVVANLPYSISSPFLIGLLAPPGPPRRATVMLQREVADVLMARPGSDEYSALSLLAQVFVNVRRAFDVGPSAFHPRPEVDSSVVVIEPRSDVAIPFRPFLEFSRRLFQQRRKALRSSLVMRFGITAAEAVAALSAAGLTADDRVDNVDAAALVRLFGQLGGRIDPDDG